MVILIRNVIILSLLALPAHAASAAVGAAAGAVVVTPHVRAELVAHAPHGVQPGQPLSLALAFTHQPHWHTYWKNAGDSGLPTTPSAARLRWRSPPGTMGAATIPERWTPWSAQAVVQTRQPALRLPGEIRRRQLMQ